MEKEIHFLQAKFFTPKAGGNLIHRPRLTRIIETGMNTRVLLISAPAGFGKTSLLTDWIGEYQRNPAWITLDTADNDPSRFASYLIKAYSFQRSSILQKLLEDNFQSFKGDSREEVEILLNCMFDCGEKAILVLDDFHHLHSPNVLSLINFFIENLPANASVILSTRSDPPLNLANWRARGHLTEIRQADLCFNEAEAKAFIAQNIPYDLSSEHVKGLIHKVEGWPAGLQLASNAILRQTNRIDAEKFIQSFRGTNHFILEYLMEEVLNKQSEEIRKFLFSTSLLDRFCAPLCDFILDRKNSQSILEMLEHNNLFIVALDDQQKWYRYHRLFSDLLKSQIDSQEKQDKKKIIHAHKLAAEWYEQNGLFSEAIEHYFSAGDDTNAARLIQAQAKNVLNRSEFFTFSNWVRRLPQEYLTNNLTLCAYYAISLIIQAHPMQEIREVLEIMDRVNSDDTFDQTIVRLLLNIIQGNYQEATRCIQEIRANPPAEDEFLIGLLDIAQNIVFQKDLQSTLNQLLNTYRKARTSGNLTIAITSLCYAGDLVQAQGKLHNAWKYYQEALSLARIGQDDILPAGSIPLLDMGEVSYKWNQLDEAEEYLKKSLELSVNWEIMHFFSGLTSLARVEIALGKFEEANSLMQKAEELAQQFDVTDIDDFVVACRVIQLKLLMGESNQLDELENRMSNSIHQKSWQYDSLLLRFALTFEIQELTQAYVLLYKDKYSQAIPLLSSLLDNALDSQLEDYAIQYAVLLAIAYHKNRNREKSLEAIGVALRFAKKENQIRIFLEQGVEIIDLLYDAADQGIESEYAKKILSLFPQMKAVDQNDPLIHYKDEIIEPLSSREIEVLAHISNGLSNQEIACKLHLSLSTVKVHTYNIFRKLNVHNRTQAVAKARLINILS